MPPSTRASLPPLPAAIDQDPEPVGQLKDGEMGTLAIDNVELAQRYGRLGIRFNTLREFYRCVREAANAGKGAEGCK